MADLALQSGLKALLSTQLALDTVGHNIANATTEGYSRQRVGLTSAMPVLSRGFLIGSGVDVGRVQRSVDALLQRRLLGQHSTSGRLELQLARMGEVESLFSAQLDGGLGSIMDQLFASVSALAGSPEDGALRGGVVQAAASLTDRFGELASGLDVAREDAVAELGVRVGEVNQLAQRISTLNLEIAKAETAGHTANDLRDQRDLALRDLARIVDLTSQESANGAVTVLIAGNMLVSPTRAYALSLSTDAGGGTALAMEGAQGTVKPKGGTLGGLMRLAEEFVPSVREDLDLLARNLILEVNRAHSTGVPAAGSFARLTGANRVRDVDQDGQLTDELLANAGLPFDVATGTLRVNVTDHATGEVSGRAIEIDATRTTVGDLLAALNAVPHVAASLDGSGRVQVWAEPGHGFDFSRRIDRFPDDAGSFGGMQASLSTASAEPFALAPGATLLVTAQPGGTPAAIAFDPADFADMSEATAEELAAAINQNAGAQGAGIQAQAVAGRLVLQTAGGGAGTGLTLDGGTAVAALGWTSLVGTTATGSDLAATLEVHGAWGGSADDTWTFTPTGDGTVGTTPGLAVEVRDASGALVATLDVGAGYQPGTELAVADGISVSFGLGELSATHNDFASVDLVADSDSSDVLVALGLNAFFVGSDAASIDLRADLADDPSLIAASASGAAGDNGNLLDLLDVAGLDVAGLGGRTLGEHFGGMVSGIGFDVASTGAALAANDALRTSLEQRQQELSGVNVDEELVDLMRFEQGFQAASRYIGVINQLNEELLSMI